MNFTWVDMYFWALYNMSFVDVVYNAQVLNLCGYELNDWLLETTYSLVAFRDYILVYLQHYLFRFMQLLLYTFSTHTFMLIRQMFLLYVRDNFTNLELFFIFVFLIKVLAEVVKAPIKLQTFSVRLMWVMWKTFSVMLWTCELED